MGAVRARQDYPIAGKDRLSDRAHRVSLRRESRGPDDRLLPETSVARVHLRIRRTGGRPLLAEQQTRVSSGKISVRRLIGKKA